MKGRQLFYMVRDFARVSSGRDYFHQPQRIGAHFRDSRCYYNDLTGKATWNGPYIDGVPALYVPAWGKQLTLPVMVLQYGIGSIDRFLLEGDLTDLERVKNVASWIPKNLLADGSFDNYTPEIEPQFEYHSSNHAMVQGEALSFCTRVIQYQLTDRKTEQTLRDCVKAIFTNMLRPLEENGTVLTQGSDVYFCEFCRKDDYVVLNGWIFAIFGLIDFVRYERENKGCSVLNATVASLKKSLQSYRLSDGWSYYDNKGRVCSPFYHTLHVNLLDALYRLTGEQDFDAMARCFRGADTRYNRARYTLSKVVDKLRDRQVYLSQH